jgi:hypothetical protein
MFNRQMERKENMDFPREYMWKEELESMEKFVMRLDKIIATSYPPEEFEIISLSFTEKHAMLSYYQNKGV